MPRARSVLSPKIDRKRKAKPESSAPAPVITGWRARPLDLDPFGIEVPTFYGTEDECRAWAVENAELRPVVECRTGALYGAPGRDVPMVADLAAQGMARQTQDGKAWHITPLGYDVLTDAMLGRDE